MLSLHKHGYYDDNNEYRRRIERKRREENTYIHKREKCIKRFANEASVGKRFAKFTTPLRLIK